MHQAPGDDPLKLRPVGVVIEAGDVARIRIHEQYGAALLKITPGEEYWVLYWMHRLAESGRELLQAYPMGDRSKEKRGVFALRSPMRPNPIGLTRVKLLQLDGNILIVEGLDAFEGSPVIDIKPC